MIYLSAEDLTKHYAEQLLFEKLKFSLHKGDKVGLIANNGAGKSSLIKVLLGKDIPDEGIVYLRDSVKLGYLEQEPVFDDKLTINELIAGSHSELLIIIREYENALKEQTENYSDKSQKVFELASTRMDQSNAWDYERKLKQLLTLFNITNLNQLIGLLSGGEKKRLALAMTLLDSPDMLIMDEPTNHLDVDMIEWLEKYLSQSSITLLMVTHDRYFLDRICNHILELQDGKMYHHKGNYSYFLEKRNEREMALKSEIDKAGKLMKKELEWIRRSPKARTTKSKSRINSFYEIKEKAATKTTEDKLQLEVKMSRIGGKILEMKNVTKSYGVIKIMQSFTYVFKKGERIGIVGKNGVGKTTFLNIATGDESVDSGRVNSGDNTVFGYYSQEGLVLKKDKRIIDVIKDIAEVITLGNGKKLTASAFLQHFLFPVKMQRRFYSELSGGERRKLHLLTVLIRNPNFLILDEPTNDLDLMTLNKLEEFLESYKGCLILVSHDRYFMEKLVDQLLVFEGDGNIRGFVGNYSDYREAKEAQLKKEKALLVKVKSKQKVAGKPNKTKTKLSYKENQEYKDLEKEIEGLELEKTALEQSINDSITEYETLMQMTERMGTVITLIDEKTLRWMELDEYV
ncbi:MAG: ABC-F family ATP-binding cassette domain-containing protein [Bacteroidales bacterium]|nr:ABC-F family ATP-binding cassette domain-containing protein [Bacteroidales bacterium]